MRISAIEIGTNSTKFIVAELTEKGKVDVLLRTSTVNRLSGGMYPEKKLNDEAINKGIEIIGDLINESKKWSAKLVSIFSTSVLRDAVNKNIFTDKVKAAYGFDIDVISGDKEAYYAYTACRELVEDQSKKFSVIDIGGGSTEIIIADSRGIQRKVSINVGAVRLTEMFVKCDPITDSELEKISEYINKKLEDVNLLDLDGSQLVGTGGSIKSLGTIYLQNDFNNEAITDGRVLKINEIELIFESLKLLRVEEKILLIGLNPKRADVITAGVCILLTIMKNFNIEEIKVSKRGVLEGFIWSEVN